MNLNSKNKNRYIDWAINAGSLIFFCVCLVSPYYLARIGVNFADEPYQILMAKNINNTPLTFGTSILAGCWGDTLGWNILSMRYFAITVQLIPFIVACYVMWRSIRQSALSLMIAGVCIFLMNGMFNFTLMGWDAVSNASIMCLGILAFYYCRRATMRRVALLALFASISVCIRFPNVVVIPIIMLTICFICVKSSGWKTALRQEVVFVVTAVLLVIFLITLVYGSIFNYITIVRGTLISSHSLGEMLEHWLGLIFYVFPFAIMLMFVFFTIRLAYIYQRSTFYAILICAGWFFLYVNFWSMYMGVEHSLLINHLMYAFFMVISAYTIAKYRQNSLTTDSTLGTESLGINQDEVCKVIVTVAALLCLSLVSGVGSNCGIYKILALSFVPLIIIYLRRVVTKPFVVFSILFLLIISPTVLAYKWTKSFNDAGIRRANVVCQSVKKFNHLYTTESRAVYLQNINNLIEQNREGTVVFLSDCGPERYLGYYLADIQPQYSQSNWQVGLFSDETYIDETQRYIQSIEGPVTLFVLNETDPSAGSKMIEMIQSLNPSSFKKYYGIIIYKINSPLNSPTKQ